MGRILNKFALATALAALAGGWAAPALAGNPAAGAGVFKAQCGVCHSNNARAAGGVGPRLFGVVGRHAGSVPGFAYSPAMKSSGVTWSAERLSTYLANPAKTIKGNKMPYAGLHNPAQLADLVAYLATLK